MGKPNPYFEVKQEIGPIRTRNQANSKSFFHPVYVKSTSETLLCVDQYHHDVLEICRRTGTIHFRFSAQYSKALLEPLCAFRMGLYLIILERSGVLWAIDGGSYRRIDISQVKGRIIAIEPLNGCSFYLLTREPSRIYLLSITGQQLFQIQVPDSIVYPQGLSITSKGHFIISDPEINTIFELDKEGKILWDSSGVRDVSGNHVSLLCSSHAVQDRSGTLFVADKFNNRIIGIDQILNRVVFVYGEDKEQEIIENILSQPRYIELLEDNSMLVCDAGNNRIVEVTRAGKKTREYGKTNVVGWVFGFPRGIIQHQDAYLVADPFRNRIFSFSEDGHVEAIFRNRSGRDEGNLFWPRNLQSGKKLLVADNRNGRVAYIEDGQAITFIDRYVKDGYSHQLSSVVDLKVLNENHLLLLDGRQGVALIVDQRGEVIWYYDDLADPHSISLTSDRHILIADSGNKRLIELSHDSQIVWECRAVIDPQTRREIPISPKFACSQMEGDGIIIVDDVSRSNSILCVDRQRNLRWRFDSQSLRNQDCPYLNAPRWYLQISPTEFYISDYGNRRVLRVEMQYA